jgi:hypothetical protein
VLRRPKLATACAVSFAVCAGAPSIAGARPARSTDAAATVPKQPGRHFSSRVTNPWFPLAPGTVLSYRGVREGHPSRDIMTVKRSTRIIHGAPCRVVKDLLYLSGKLAERTTDWYTQDDAGNVWYYGEATAELSPSGRVTSTEGSWQSGVGGAKPGIFMPARPRVGYTGRQEYLKGEAEDHFRIRSLTAVVHTVAASSSRALLTEEWTPLEPRVLDHKLYVRGIGTVLEQTVRGGDERNSLVSVTHR